MTYILWGISKLGETMKKRANAKILAIMLATKGTIAFAASGVYHCQSFNLYSEDPMSEVKLIQVDTRSSSTLIHTPEGTFPAQTVKQTQHNISSRVAIQTETAHHFSIMKDLDHSILPEFTKALAIKNRMPASDQQLLHENFERSFEGINLNGIHSKDSQAISLLSCTEL